jgi:hypothetical protein
MWSVHIIIKLIGITDTSLHVLAATYMHIGQRLRIIRYKTIWTEKDKTKWILVKALEKKMLEKEVH